MEYLWIPLLIAVAAFVAWKSPKETHGPMGCVGRVHADLQAKKDRKDKEAQCSCADGKPSERPCSLL